MLSSYRDKAEIPLVPSLYTARYGVYLNVYMQACWELVNIWQGENLDRLFSKVYECRLDKGIIRVTGALAGVSRLPFFRYTLSVLVQKDGAVSFSLAACVGESDGCRCRYPPVPAQTTRMPNSTWAAHP